MTDHEKDTPSTPPDTPAHRWEDTPAFREVFLAHFPPGAADAFREAGRHLYDAALESDTAPGLSPWVAAQVLAVAKDLRMLIRLSPNVRPPQPGG